MADDDRAAEALAADEAVGERRPAREGVRAAPLRIAEGRQVDREHAVVVREQRRGAVPDPRRLDESPEQEDRAAVRPPVGVREARPVHDDGRAGVAKRVAVARGEVVGERRKGEQDDEPKEEAHRLLCALRSASRRRRSTFVGRPTARGADRRSRACCSRRAIDSAVSS